MKKIALYIILLAAVVITACSFAANKERQQKQTDAQAIPHQPTGEVEFNEKQVLKHWSIESTLQAPKDAKKISAQALMIAIGCKPKHLQQYLELW